MTQGKSKESSLEKSSEPSLEQNKQQILFSETQLSPVNKDKHVSKEQIIFNNQDWLPTEQSTDSDDYMLSIEEACTSKPRWLWRIVFTLLSIIVVIEAADFFITGFNQTPIFASLYALLLCCLLFIAGTVFIKELMGLKHFNEHQQIKKQAINVLQQKQQETIDVVSFCDKISQQLPSDLLSEQELKWQGVLENDYSDAELLQLYSTLVLAKVDQKAIAEIAKFSTEAVVLIALSPIAIIDMLIILWRNIRMMNKVSRLYGLKLNYWSRIKLIRQVFVNMAYAGASELVADFGTEMLGADLLGKVSTRLAQGAGAGMLTARLGLKTLQLCRPIPFEQQKPTIGHIRKEILNQIKQLIKS